MTGNEEIVSEINITLNQDKIIGKLLLIIKENSNRYLSSPEIYDIIFKPYAVIEGKNCEDCYSEDEDGCSGIDLIAIDSDNSISIEAGCLVSKQIK